MSDIYRKIQTLYMAFKGYKTGSVYPDYGTDLKI